MKRNLLFISRYPEIIDEFQGILEEKQIETDIAQNGTDAMELLKQKEYQILVTDLNLDGYNGDKIISYVNQVFPTTICMLYKNSISAVQLGFYLNKRDVFRVFLLSLIHISCMTASLNTFSPKMSATLKYSFSLIFLHPFFSSKSPKI